MAKELPYFQFEPAEYLTKDISFCSLAAQGLFINICAYYWHRECNLTKSQLLRRLNYEKELNELIQEGVIDLEGELIKIKFLLEQYAKATEKSAINKRNGAKGGRPKNLKKTELKPNGYENQNRNESESKGIREEKRREEKRKKENNNNASNNPLENEPSIDEFVNYAFEKAQLTKMKLSERLVREKYASWQANDWMTLSDNPRQIKNWKSTLTNSLKYMIDKNNFLNNF
jgi:hypothetical protein